MSKRRVRADELLLTRGLATTRSQARSLIMAGRVWHGDRRVEKPGELLPPDTELRLTQEPRYVSRGGEKLEHALRMFAIDVNDLVCADFGASTGGFTDALLQHGARRVYAIDVGYGQLHYRLRQDSRVVVMERTNVRYLESLPEPIDLVTIDVSFISLRLVLPAARRVLRPGGRVIALVKPQFEAGKGKVGKGVSSVTPLSTAKCWNVSSRQRWNSASAWKVSYGHRSGGRREHRIPATLAA